MQQLATVLFFSLPRAGCGKFGQPPSTIRCSHHRPPRLGGLCNRQQQVAAAHVQAPHPPRPEGDASDASQTPEAGRRPGQSVASWRHLRTSEVHTRLSGQCCLRAAPESFAPWLRRPTWISTPPMRVRRRRSRCRRATFARAATLSSRVARARCVHPARPLAQGGPGGRCFRVCSEPWEGRMRRPGAAPACEGVLRAPQEGCG